jgi:hypothetical protein
MKAKVQNCDDVRRFHVFGLHVGAGFVQRFDHFLIS